MDGLTDLLMTVTGLRTVWTTAIYGTAATITLGLVVVLVMTLNASLSGKVLHRPR